MFIYQPLLGKLFSYAAILLASSCFIVFDAEKQAGLLSFPFVGSFSYGVDRWSCNDKYGPNWLQDQAGSILFSHFVNPLT